uniref:Lipase n=1 Tax=Anthurium amnicola TaxID=1678845 RepID=A0A1D1YBE4_9ARAE
MFGLKRANSAPSPSNLNQDDDEPYPAEADGFYGAMPVVDSSMLTEPKEIKLNFEGKDRDTFVLVPGLLGFNRFEFKQWVIADYWSDVKDIVEDPFISSPSPLGSIHDRAVELYYQIRGGQVDYGLQHSYQFCHNQFGATYEGFMPHWNPDNPIVLIGKGYGATTALYLQHLLSTNFFGQHTSGRMVKAVICLSAPHRGSTLPYWFGLEAGSKCVVNPLSLLQLFLSFIHIVCYFACLDRIFSFQLNDKWNLSSREEGGEQSIWSAISARSKFAYFGDNFLVDWSVEGARMRYAGEEKDKHILDPDCVYVNYITTGSSWKSKITGHYWPRLTWRNFPTATISAILGQYKMTSDVEQHVLRTSSSTFWENNGTLSVYSQQPPPHQRVQMNIDITEKLFDPVDHELTPGAWYNVYVEDRSNTVLFDDEPFLATLPLVEQILEINAVKRFGEYLSKNTDSFEYYYIYLVECLERQLCYLRTKLTIKSDGNSVVDIKDIGYVTSTEKPYLMDDTLGRFEVRSSDKAGEEWCRKINTEEIMNSPSRMLYYINNIQKLYSTVESGVGGSQNLTSFKDDFSTNALIPSGPMFIKARHKMTTEDYRTSVQQ